MTRSVHDDARDGSFGRGREGGPRGGWRGPVLCRRGVLLRDGGGGARGVRRGGGARGRAPPAGGGERGAGGGEGRRGRGRWRRGTRAAGGGGATRRGCARGAPGGGGGPCEGGRTTTELGAPD